MNNTLRVIFRGIGWAIVALLVVNLIGFAVELSLNGIPDDWSFRFKHGTFFINGEATGLIFGERNANILMALVFVFVVYRGLRK
ncbi:MAG: hypothetical protein R3275_09740 [Saprospiraceae bacterium]|nr:hypothetical protein [Saprospiraceae bacterium]